MNIIIEDVRIRMKLENFLKTCESLLRNHIEVNQAMQAITSYKMLLSFLKKSTEYSVVYEKLQAVNNISEAYAVVNKIFEEGFAFFCEDTLNTKAVSVNVQASAGNVKQFSGENTASKPVKKIIVVQDDEDAFLVEASEKEQIDYYFLKQFRDDIRFFNLESAQDAAKRLAAIYGSQFDVEILNMDLDKTYYEEHNKSENTFSLRDKDDNVILYIDKKGVVTLPWNEKDTAYFYIDVNQYQDEIQQIISMEEESLSEHLDFHINGKLLGYEVGMRSNIPQTKFEIFKAYDVIENGSDFPKIYSLFPELKDIFSEDEDFYRGYIAALSHCLEIQRDYAYTLTGTSIQVLDLRKNGFAENSKKMETPYGQCFVSVYKSIPEWNFDKAFRNVVLVFCDKESSIDSIKEQLILPEDIEIYFRSNKKKSKNINWLVDLKQIINPILAASCTLGGDKEICINVDLVPSYRHIKNIVKEDTEQFTEPIELHNGYRFTMDSALVNDKKHLRMYHFKDNAVLKYYKIPYGLEDLPEGFFYNCTSLVEPVLPNTLLSIGKSAFQGCTALARIYMPDSIRVIDDNAFNGCRSLQKIYLPTKLERIGAQAFYGCSGLREINFPSKTKYVAEDAFEECPNLTKVFASSNLTLPLSLLSRVQVEYYDKKQVVDARTNSSVGDGDSQIYDMDLSSFTDMKTIQNNLFKDDAELRSIKLPDSLQVLADGLFMNCVSLQDIAMPKHLKTIGRSTFEGCLSLGSIHLPATLERIEIRAFYGCTALQEITFAASVKEVADDAFAGCGALKFVRIPRGTVLPKDLVSRVEITYFDAPTNEPLPEDTADTPASGE